MYKRESFSKNYLRVKNGKAFLISKSPNVRIIAMHGSCIKLGKKIPVDKGDTILVLIKQFQKALVSVAMYDGVFLNEIFYEMLPYNQTEADYELVRKVFSDMKTPNIYEA